MCNFRLNLDRCVAAEELRLAFEEAAQRRSSFHDRLVVEHIDHDRLTTERVGHLALPGVRLALWFGGLITVFSGIFAGRRMRKSHLQETGS